MTADFKVHFDGLTRTRAGLEARLAEVPAWAALKELDASGAGTTPYRAAARQALIDQLKGNAAYQGWLEAGAALAKLAVDAARRMPTTLPAAIAEAVATAPVAKGGALPKVAGPRLTDDLMQIRGMTQARAVALHRLGVRRFADIASWTTADVARVSAALDLGDAVRRQNWIEQAAARVAAGNAPQPAPALPVAEPPPPAVAAAAAGKTEEPAAAPPPVDDLTRIRGITPAIADGLRKLGETSFTSIANWTAADVARVSAALGVGEAIGRQSWIEQAAMRVPAAALRVSSPVPAVATAASTQPQPTAEKAGPVAKAVQTPPAKKPAGPAVAADPDDLTRIRVIKPLLAKKLNVIGVTSFDTIANWSSLDVERVASVLDIGDKISREAWIEQAAMRVLRRGGVLKPAAVVVRPAPPTPAPEPAPAESPVVAAVSPPRPAESAAPASKSEPAAKPSPATAVAAAAAVPPAFAAALAAVKAELSAPAPQVAPEPAAASPAPSPTGPDRLTSIAGITSLVAEQLNVIGVSRFADIAGWTAGDVARVAQVLDNGDRIGREVWIEQAAVLARGGVTMHAARAAAHDASRVPLPPPPLTPLPKAVTPRAEPPAPPAGVATAVASALDGLQAIADAALARSFVGAPPVAAAAPPLSAEPAHHGVMGVDSAIAELQAIADEAAARIAAEPVRPLAAASMPAPPMPAAPMPAAAVAPPPLPAAAPVQVPAAVLAPAFPAVQPAVTPPPIQQVSPWPRMTDAAPRSVPVRKPVPPAVNDVPGPAEAPPQPAHVPPEASVTVPAPTAPPPLPPRDMESGLAAALAAAAATASASPRLTSGRLGDQIRMLPPVSPDPYLEDLSDWVQDAAAELPAVPAGAPATAPPGGEAEVAIVRAETVVGDLGAVTPGADHFDAAGYAAYRREVHEASVEIVGAAAGKAASAAADGAAAGGPPERGLKRLMRALRGDPSRG